MFDHPDRWARELARARNEAVTRTPPQAKRPHVAPTPAEAALVLVRALYPMLRQSTPELKNATPPSNA